MGKISSHDSGCQQLNDVRKNAIHFLIGENDRILQTNIHSILVKFNELAKILYQKIIGLIV